jgi:hypothetical protein
LTTVTAPATSKPSSKDLWLVSPGYDLALIIFSSALLVFPHLFSLLGGFSNVIVDLVVTAFIGGPHLFATYTMTFMEPHFRQRYRRYTWSALFLPVLVVSLAIINLTLLVTIFFFWASVHVIHQAAYIADSYRFKDPRSRSANRARWRIASRVIDYGLLMTSLYPIATFKFTGVPLVVFGYNLSSHGAPFPRIPEVRLDGATRRRRLHSVLYRVRRQDALGVAGWALARAEDAAHEPRCRALLHHTSATEPGRSIPRAQCLAFLPIPRGRALYQQATSRTGPDRLRVRDARLQERA